jgi:hypothetical protein
MSESIAHSASKIFLSASAQLTNKKITKLSNARMVFPVEPLILHNDDPSHFVLGLEQISCPLSFYVFTSANNFLAVSSLNFLTTATFTIPVWNYAIEDIMTTLNSQIPGWMNFTYNYQNNLISIVGGLADTLTIVSTTTASTQLGCVIGQTATSSISYPTLTFTNCVNLTTTNGIILRLNGINTNNKDSTSTANSIIARIPITTQPFTYLQYFNPVTFYLTLSNRVINQFDVELLDDYYQPLIFNSPPDWFVVLKVDYVNKEQLTIPPTTIQQLRKDVSVPIATTPNNQVTLPNPLTKTT